MSQQVSSETMPATSRAPLYVAMVTLVAATGGLLFGFDTGVISGAIMFITPAFALSPAAVGLLVSVVTLGALFGALGGGSLADRFGRRPTLIGAGALFVVSALASAFASGLSVLIVSRLVIGVAVGLTSGTAPMYIAEMAPAAVRGRLVSLFQLAVTVGILVSYICDHALAPHEAWRWMLGLGAVPGLILFFGMLSMPESPRWLLKSGAKATARSVLLKIRDPKEAGSRKVKSRKTLPTSNQPHGQNCWIARFARRSSLEWGSRYSSKSRVSIRSFTTRL